MSQSHALRLARGPRRIEDREEVRLDSQLRRRKVAPSSGGDEVLELKDLIVIPQLGVPNRDEVVQLRELREEILEELEITDVVMFLDHDGAGRLGVAKHVLQLGQREAGVQRHDRSTELSRAEHGDRELGARGQDERDPVPGLDAQVM